MNRLIVYFIIYVLLISVVGIYLNDFNINGVNITKSRFIVASLIVPFLILAQWSFETLFDVETTSRKSIVGKVLSILIGLSLAFVLIFYMTKFLIPILFSKTVLVLVSLFVLTGLLLSIPQTRETTKYIYNYIKLLVKKGFENILLFFNNLSEIELTASQKFTYGTIIILTVLLILSREYETIIKKLLLPKHKTLLKEPIYLQREQNLGSTENINMKHITEEERKKNKSLREDIQLDLNYNYALSTFVYLNPQGQNTRASYNKFTKIFDFGENPTVYLNSKTNQLKLEFYIEDNVKKDIFISLNEKNKLFYQKWNSFVFNVNGGDVDVFLNGKLIHHQQITNKYKIEAITTGEERGINGGIKEVMFFNTPLKLYQIHLLNYMAN